ncbi:unnamed protein product, partial [Rotaria sp. Silwood2]
STITEEKPSIKQLTSIEDNFNLRPKENYMKPKITQEDFFLFIVGTKSTPVKDVSDRFNQLDSL